MLALWIVQTLLGIALIKVISFYLQVHTNVRRTVQATEYVLMDNVFVTKELQDLTALKSCVTLIVDKEVLVINKI